MFNQEPLHSRERPYMTIPLQDLISRMHDAVLGPTLRNRRWIQLLIGTECGRKVTERDE